MNSCWSGSLMFSSCNSSSYYIHFPKDRVDCIRSSNRSPVLAGRSWELRSLEKDSDSPRRLRGSGSVSHTLSSWVRSLQSPVQTCDRSSSHSPSQYEDDALEDWREGSTISVAFFLPLQRQRRHVASVCPRTEMTSLLLHIASSWVMLSSTYWQTSTAASLLRWLGCGWRRCQNCFCILGLRVATVIAWKEKSHPVSDSSSGHHGALGYKVL